MALYVVIENATGAQRRVSTTRLFQQTELETVLVFPDLDAEPSAQLQQWDRAVRQYVDLPTFTPPAVSTTKLTVLEFKARFTTTERVAIERAQGEHEDLNVRAMLRVIEKDMSDAKDKTVDRADPRTQQGVGYLASVTFGGAPLIAASRVDEIIGADAL